MDLVLPVAGNEVMSVDFPAFARYCDCARHHAARAAQAAAPEPASGFVS